MKLADQCLVVVLEAKDRLLKKAPDAYKKISIVSNTPSLKVFSNSNIKKIDTIEMPSSSFILSYIGRITNLRGLDLVIKAMPRIIEAIPDAVFVLAGNGNAEQSLKKLAIDLNVEKHIKFVGWIEYTDIPSHIASCHIGVLPFQSCEHMNNTIANKIFDYMAMGKAIVVSDVRPMERITQEEKCGISFTAGDFRSLADTVIKLHDSEKRNSFGQNGKTAFHNKYNWETDEKELMRVVNLFGG